VDETGDSIPAISNKIYETREKKKRREDRTVFENCCEPTEEERRKQIANETVFQRVSPFMRRNAGLSRCAEPAARVPDRLIKTEQELQELRSVLLRAIEQLSCSGTSRVKEAAQLILNGHTGQALARKMRVTKQRASQIERKVHTAFQELRRRRHTDENPVWTDLEAFWQG
jgi:hypothetical protein